MGAVIFFCRAFPFIFFRGIKTNDKWGYKFLIFIEKTAPPIAMTVLCFNTLVIPVKENSDFALPTLWAAAVTILLHLWKRNVLLSIFSGTALFMLLQQLTVNS
jgi:branched-subunit amino acid transport protein AzlD